MSIQTYETPNEIIVDDLAPSANYNPALNLKMRVIAYLTALESNSYRLDMNIEHYAENDPEKATIRNGIIQPYTRFALVNESGRAYRNLVTGETLIPESLEQLEQSPNPWMREIEYFNLVFNTQEVIMSEFIRQVIIEQHSRGNFN